MTCDPCVKLHPCCSSVSIFISNLLHANHAASCRKTNHISLCLRLFHSSSSALCEGDPLQIKAQDLVVWIHGAIKLVCHHSRKLLHDNLHVLFATCELLLWDG